MYMYNYFMTCTVYSCLYACIFDNVQICINIPAKKKLFHFITVAGYFFFFVFILLLFLGGEGVGFCNASIVQVIPSIAALLVFFPFSLHVLPSSPRPRLLTTLEQTFLACAADYFA